MFDFLGHILDAVLVYPCLNVLVLLYEWVGNFTLTLLLFTVFVQALFSPLTLYGMFAQKRMNATMKTLQPEFQALREQYANDRQKLREAGQALYKKHNINPTAGCLPVLIPILFLVALWLTLVNPHLTARPATVNQVLYSFIPGLSSPLDPHFSWIRSYAIDLTQPEPLAIHVLAVLASLLVFIQIKMVMPSDGVGANDGSGKRTGNIISLGIVLFALVSFWMLPAGLVFYTIISTLIAIALQFYVNGWNWGGLFPGKKDGLVQVLQANHRFFAKGNSNLAEIALTFDDGPDPTYTPQVLEVLQRYNVKATFFTIGKFAQEHPELVKQQIADGHNIGNHTWNHVRLSALPIDEVRKEMNDTADELEKITGTRPTYVRPPFGETSEQVLQVFNDLGFTTFLWSKMAFDWLAPASKVIVDRVTRGAQNGMIILLHDGGGDRANTVAALPAIIENLQKRGFQFVTLDQLVEHAKG